MPKEVRIDVELIGGMFDGARYSMPSYSDNVEQCNCGTIWRYERPTSPDMPSKNADGCLRFYLRSIRHG